MIMQTVAEWSKPIVMTNQSLPCHPNRSLAQTPTKQEVDSVKSGDADSDYESDEVRSQVLSIFTCAKFYQLF